MQFRLTYEGKLLGASRNNPRAPHKHEIRKVFHRQLRLLCSFHPAFDWFQEEGEGQERIRHHTDQFERCGYRFFPLATLQLSLLCGVDILFLRPDRPGVVLHGGSGDLDNRLKTLFDALRMPTSKDELGGYATPEADEDPFYCLLEDDSLINSVSVDADTLLQPIGHGFDRNDARVVLTVRLQPYKQTWRNVGYA